MDTIDTHMHVNLECNSKHYGSGKLDDYFYNNSRTVFSIPSVNPKIVFYACDLDCINTCKIREVSNDIVCPTDCKDRKRHRIVIVDDVEGRLIAYCTSCKKIIYSGSDPFRKYNIQLMEMCAQTNYAKPNLVLSMSNSTINGEIRFYENNFANMFLGYKLHPTINMRNIKSIDLINSSRPILIHCDSHGYDSIENAIDFAKIYKGNVILAHSYLLCNPIIISKMNNLYFDVCPIDVFKKYKGFIEHNKSFKLFNNVYDAALLYLSEDKLLFGTDWPYGNIFKNIHEVDNAQINDKAKEKILSLNAQKAYKL